MAEHRGGGGCESEELDEAGAVLHSKSWNHACFAFNNCLCSADSSYEGNEPMRNGTVLCSRHNECHSLDLSFSKQIQS